MAASPSSPGSPNPPVFSIRAPDHLGDGVMALPVVEALGLARGADVHAPRWGAGLYAGLTGVRVRAVDEPPEGKIGVLLKPSFGAAWRWRALPERIGVATHRRGWLLTQALPERSEQALPERGEHALPERSEHRRQAYARVAAALGVNLEAGAGPVFRPRGVAPGGLPARFVALNPWSPSPTVRWPRFGALAEALRGAGVPVVWFAGPGEEAQVRGLAGADPLAAGLELSDFAAALAGCALFLSNDSGAAHFAAACGAPVVMIHGSTDPARTGVGVALRAPPPWCAPCYRKWCFNGLECLTRLPVEDAFSVALAAFERGR